MNQLNASVFAQIKAAAVAAANAAKEVAPKGTKMPVAQWTKRNQFETDGTKTLRSLLDQGYVVSSIGKPTVTKAGEVGVNFKIAAPQVSLETKVQNHVTATMNAAARRKAKREAAQAAKAPAAKPAPAAPAAPAKPAAPVTDATSVLAALAAMLPAKAA